MTSPFRKNIGSPKSEEYQLLECMRKILKQPPREDRTGAGTHSIFGNNMRFSLDGQFPLITTRRLPLRHIFEELMWFLRGQTDTNILREKKINVWNGNTSREFLDSVGLNHYPEGELGSSYGWNMRHFGADFDPELDDSDYNCMGFDQLKYVLDLLRTNPTSRRILISLWNPSTMHQAALVPCGFCYQFYVDFEDGVQYLSCKTVQRSSDISLAGGWNIASSSLFVYMLAHVTGMKPRKLIWSTGDTHIYLNQVDGAREQITREPRPFPTLEIVKDPRDNDICNFEWDHFKLVDYNPHSRISLTMNV